MAKYYKHDIARWESEGGFPGQQPTGAPVWRSGVAKGADRAAMQPAWKILAPIDLAADSEVRVQHAIQVATALAGELTLLYVVEPGSRQQARKLDWPADALTSDLNGRIRRIVLPGDVAETIGHYADDMNADLVTITSRHYGRWMRFRKDSIAAELMSSTHRTVCVTSTRSLNTDRPFECRRVLCVVALDGTDDPVLLQAQALAERCSGELILLHIVPEIRESVLAYRFAGADDRPLSERVAKQRIGDLSASLSVPHTTSVMTGSAYKCIGAAVQSHRADIVVAARFLPEPVQSSGLDLRTIMGRLDCPLISVAAPSRLDRRTEYEETAVCV
jgi:nucleotide-binding universal stress UspA family protein